MILSQRLQLLGGLLSREIAHTGPLYVDLDLTRRCNLQCLGCPFHSPDGGQALAGDHAPIDMSFELVERLCEELPRLGTREVILIGEGEPMLHPRLFDIIAAFKRVGLAVQMYTNGTLIDEAKASALLDSGLDTLKVSLWASCIEDYQKCHPGVSPRNYTKTVEGVRIMAGLKAKRNTQVTVVYLTQPLNRHNYRSIGARVDLASELGCDGVRFSIFRHWQGAYASASLSTQEIETVCQDLSQAKSRLDALGIAHDINDALLRYRLGETVGVENPCFVGWFHARVEADGTLVPCCSCSVSLGNLNEHGFEELWNGPQYRGFRQRALTPGGLSSLGPACDCGWCGVAANNYRIYRLWRWIAPLAGPRAGSRNRGA